MSITVEYRRHPLTGAVEVRQMPAGVTVQGIVETVAEGVAFDVDLVRRDEAGVPHSWPVRPDVFAQVRPTPGTVVRVRPRVRAAALPAVAGWLASTTGMSVLVSQVVVGLAVSAVSMLASYLLIGAQVDGASRQADKDNPTINGLSNGYASRGLPVPLPLGRMRMAPMRVATGYTDLVGQRVYRRERMVFGPGPLALHELKIGETPIHQFDGVQVQLRNIDEAQTLAKYPQLANLDVRFLDDGDTMTLYRDTIFEDADGALLEEGVAEIRNTPEGTIAANVQIYFAGLIHYGKNQERQRWVDVGVYYRPATGGSWVTHSEETYVGKTSAILRFGERIEFPSAGAWSIKVERLTPDLGESDVYDDAYLESIQSEIDGDMPSPSGVAEIALRIKATDQLSGTLDPINAVVQQMAPVWDGTEFGDPEPIRHPADIYVALLRADYRRKPLADQRIDLAGIKAWKDAWPQWRCDMVVASDKQLGDLVREVLATGLAIPAYVDGQHSLIHDQADQPAVQVFTPRNTANFTAQWQAPPEVHAFRLVFASEDASWTDDEMVIYANDYDEETATEIEVLEPAGLALAKSDGTKRLAQWAYYHLAQVKTRTTTVSFSCDLDHLVCRRGDPVIFMSDALSNVLATGRVTTTFKVTGDLVSFGLDDHPAAISGVKAHVMFRGSTGVIQYVTATAGSSGWTVEDGSGVRVQPSGTFDVDDINVGDLAVVYEHETEPQKWLVTEIAPEFGERARVTLTEASDVPLGNMNRPLPEYDPKVINLSQVTSAGYAIEYDDGQMYVNIYWHTLYPGSSQRFRVILEDSVGATIGTKYTKGSSVRFPVQSAYPETLGATIQAWQPTERWGAAYTLTVSTAAQFDPPDPTENFQGQVVGDVLYLSWDQAAANVDYHKIRYNPLWTGATWETSIAVLNRARGQLATLPARNGTYLIKPVTYQGAKASEAMVVVVRSAARKLNAVEEISLAPAFDGTGDDGISVLGGKLIYASDGNVFDMANIYDVESWFVWRRATVTASFTMADIVDLGAVDTVQVSAELDVYGYFDNFNIYDVSNVFDQQNVYGDADSEWSVTVEISTTDDDTTGSPTWSDWSELVVGDYRARGFRFRLVFEIEDESVLVEVNDVTIIVDMADRIEKGSDITVPLAGVTVSFDPPFRAKPAIVIDAQGLPAGGRSVKSAASNSGFTLNFIDSDGDPVAGTADWTAIGYGREGS